MEATTRAAKLPPIVVLGANGFIGSHLVDELVARNHRVIAADRFRSGNNRFRLSPDAVVRIDVEAGESLERVLSPGCDVVDAMGSNSPWLSATYDYPAGSTLPRSSLAALRESEKVGVGRYFFCSSAGAIYGHSLHGSSSEEDAPKPESSYGQEKLSFEQELRTASVRSGFQAVSWRFANVYGPRQIFSRGQGLIARAIGALNSGESLPIFGTGSMVRDYIFVSDAVSLAIDLIEREPRYDSYNLSSGVGLSILEVLGALESRFNATFRTYSVEPVPGFPERSVASPSRVLAELGPRRIRPLAEALLDYPELKR